MRKILVVLQANLELESSKNQKSTKIERTDLYLVSFRSYDGARMKPSEDFVLKDQFDSTIACVAGGIV